LDYDGHDHEDKRIRSWIRKKLHVFVHGRNGVHGSICDESARMLSKDGRCDVGQ
jgi:hypothetical protein